MINDVSTRIRNIIKKQDSFHRSNQVFKSRDGSVQSGRSQRQTTSYQQIPTNAASYSPNSPNRKSSNRLQVPSKEQLLNNNDGFEHSINNTELTSVEEVYQQVKQKLLKEVLRPFMREMQQNMQNTFHELNREIVNIRNSMEDYSTKIYQLQKLNRDYPAPPVYNSKPPSPSPSSLKNENIFSFKLINQLADRIEALENFKEEARKSLQVLHKQIDISVNKSMKQKKSDRCKCERLIEQILKSQSHLTMELKYIKHFQQDTSKVEQNRNIDKY